ncbi:MAG: hypothetical protein QOE22_372 [Candidatus Parcubacteria bacterium]|jgi:hypothetical protein|nr:hypothetical protein [Candidatus Parcubacteria bacterium]
MTHILRSPAFLAFVLCGLFLIPSPSEAQALPVPVLRMSEAVDALPASRSDSTASFTLSESGRKVLSGTIKGSTASEAGQDANAEGAFSIRVADPGVGGLISSLFGKKDLSLAFEFKILPMRDEAYFKVTKAPATDFFDLKGMIKKWVRVDMDGEEFYGSTARLSVKEVLAALGGTSGQYPALVFTEHGSTGKEYVYDFRVNPSQLLQLINETSRLSDEEVIYTAAEASRIASQFKAVTGTLTIDKSSYLPTRITYRVAHTDYATSLLVEGTTTYSYGKVSKIKKPSGAVGLEKLLREMEESSDGGRSTLAESAIKSSLSNTRAMAELYYDGNGRNGYKGLCADADIRNVFKSAKVSVECNATPQAFAASAKLPSGKYYCVDSTGYAAQGTKKLGPKTACAR